MTSKNLVDIRTMLNLLCKVDTLTGVISGPDATSGGGAGGEQAINKSDYLHHRRQQYLRS